VASEELALLPTQCGSLYTAKVIHCESKNTYHYITLTDHNQFSSSFSSGLNTLKHSQHAIKLSSYFTPHLQHAATVKYQ